jgi:three-Cys-motif partner protein
VARAELDEVGYWTEVKLDILQKYASAYTKIMSKQKPIRRYAYIDGFAGPGLNISATSGREIEGSPSIALGIQPPFSRYHFIDMDGNRVDQLRELAGERLDVDVEVHQGDCNSVLLNEIFPRYPYDGFCRALCVLDPYRLGPNWQVVEAAGKMGSIEIFMNFMIMDANRNVLWRRPERVSKAQAARMDAKWGDDSWRKAAYRAEPNLFGAKMEEKVPRANEAVVAAYKERLIKIAQFKFVPEPIPMRNNKGSTVYYLLFASHNRTGAKIIQDIFAKYRYRGAPDVS